MEEQSAKKLLSSIPKMYGIVCDLASIDAEDVNSGKMIRTIQKLVTKSERLITDIGIDCSPE